FAQNHVGLRDKAANPTYGYLLKMAYLIMQLNTSSLSDLKNRSAKGQAGKPRSGCSQNEVSEQANLQVMPELKFG
ncbi:MAG: hypothetical protein NUV63_08575, partial [Gallionella sp.]|nr:hypothetical protein [Gallionella sp.]